MAASRRTELLKLAERVAFELAAVQDLDERMLLRETFDSSIDLEIRLLDNMRTAVVERLPVLAVGHWPMSVLEQR